MYNNKQFYFLYFNSLLIYQLVLLLKNVTVKGNRTNIKKKPLKINGQ